MNLTLLSLWLVCGLGSAVFAALAPMTRGGVLAFGIAFAGAVAWARLPLAPSAATVDVAAAVTAALCLLSARPLLAAGMAGLLAGFWTIVLADQGLPGPAAVVVAPVLALVSAALRVRRPRFAPEPLREEALLFMIALGLVAAAAPALSDGWHAAANLSLQSRQPGAAVTTAIPAWTLSVALTALVTGGLFSLWSRR